MSIFPVVLLQGSIETLETYLSVRVLVSRWAQRIHSTSFSSSEATIQNMRPHPFFHRALTSFRSEISFTVDSFALRLFNLRNMSRRGAFVKIFDELFDGIFLPLRLTLNLRTVRNAIYALLQHGPTLLLGVFRTQPVRPYEAAFF